MNDFTNYIPVLVALIAGPTAVFVTAYFSKDKVAADATKTLTEISLSLVTPQAKRIDDLVKQVGECSLRIDEVEAWAKLLMAQVIEAGVTPVTFAEAQAIHTHRRKSDIA